MIDGKKVLALIPARGQSKGLPGKNIKALAGKPLIAWSIEQAKESRYVDCVCVSTDDAAIAEAAKQYGAELPFMRPPEFATDESSSSDVALHALEAYRSRGTVADILILLQPTSPLRQSADIDRGLEQLMSRPDADALVGITEAKENPYWMKTLTPEGFIQYSFADHDKYQRRQDLPVYYRTNGALYICKTEVFLKTKTFAPPRTIGYIMPKERSVDIDDWIDFAGAESLLMTLREGGDHGHTRG